MHEVAHALIIDAHFLTNIIILTLLYIIKMYDLTLAWGKILHIFLHIVVTAGTFFHDIIFIIIVGDAHETLVVYFFVRYLTVTAELVVYTVAQGNKQVRLDVIHRTEIFLLGEELYEHVLNAILYHFAVAGKTGAERKKTIHMSVI